MLTKKFIRAFFLGVLSACLASAAFAQETSVTTSILVTSQGHKVQAEFKPKNPQWGDLTLTNLSGPGLLIFSMVKPPKNYAPGKPWIWMAQDSAKGEVVAFYKVGTIGGVLQDFRNQSTVSYDELVATGISADSYHSACYDKAVQVMIAYKGNMWIRKNSFVCDAPADKAALVEKLAELGPLYLTPEEQAHVLAGDNQVSKKSLMKELVALSPNYLSVEEQSQILINPKKVPAEKISGFVADATQAKDLAKSQQTKEWETYQKQKKAAAVAAAAAAAAAIAARNTPQPPPTFNSASNGNRSSSYNSSNTSSGYSSYSGAESRQRFETAVNRAAEKERVRVRDAQWNKR